MSRESTVRRSRTLRRPRGIAAQMEALLEALEQEPQHEVSVLPPTERESDSGG
jgi:hypothetical protein